MSKSKFDDAAKALADRLIEAIESDPGAWTKSWVPAGGAAGVPHNPVSKAIYKGWNILQLLVAQHLNGFETGRWATYKQWQSAGLQVSKGSKGTPAVRWNFKNKCDTHGWSDRKCCDGATRVVFPKVFSLFNADQLDVVEGASIPEHPQFPIVEPEERTEPDVGDVRAWFVRVGADWAEQAQDRAFYNPGADHIRTPLGDQFDTVGGYASTVAHEFVHWTGHADRLARIEKTTFGSEGYAHEELVAELGAVLTCNVIGTEHEPLENHASYLRGWLQALRADDGPRFLVKVAGAASKAVEFLVAEQGDVEPAETLWEDAVAA